MANQSVTEEKITERQSQRRLQKKEVTGSDIVDWSFAGRSAYTERFKVRTVATIRDRRHPK